MAFRSRLRSPNDIELFFAKTLLLSFWAGSTLLALLLAPPIFRDGAIANSFWWIVIFALFACGIGHAIFICMTITLSAESVDMVREGRVQDESVKQTPRAGFIERKRKPVGLIAAVGLGLSLLVAAPMGYSNLVSGREGGSGFVKATNLGLKKKCSEVAELERKLFKLDAATVMAECLGQYKGR